MTRNAAPILTISLSAIALATALRAQEVVYVIPAASPEPVASPERADESGRLTSSTFRGSRRDGSLRSQSSLWRRNSRSDLYATSPPGGGGGSTADGENGSSGDNRRGLTDRSGIRSGEVRATAPISNDGRERRVLYSHRVREGGLVDPYARLQPDGRSAPLPGSRTNREVSATATGPAISAAGSGRPPRADTDERSVTLPGTQQPASSAETYSALNSSIGAAGTSNSLFVDGALATVKERSRPDWDSLGIRAGAFILRPTASFETEVTDNATLSETNRKTDIVGILRAGFSADSDWSRHALSASLSTEIGRYARETGENYASINASIFGRLDVRETTSIDAELSYSLSRESVNTLSTSSGSADRPYISTYHVSSRRTHRFNRLSLTLRGAFDYADYGGSWLTGSKGSGYNDRDYADISTSLRATYDVKPGLSVYTEGGVSLRRHDEKVDSNGLRRNSNGVSGQVGARFELGRFIRADASLGIVHRNYKDDTLKDVTAITANAQLAWNVTELTTVYAEVSTDVSETDLAGASASVEREVVFGVQHELLRNVILGAELRGAYTTAIGDTTKETAFSANLNAEYRINRNSTLTASATRAHRNSNQAGSDYVENTLRLGLNLAL